MLYWFLTLPCDSPTRAQLGFHITHASGQGMGCGWEAHVWNRLKGGEETRRNKHPWPQISKSRIPRSSDPMEPLPVWGWQFINYSDIFHVFFVHLYILLVGRPQHYGPVFHHISKLVLQEISLWVLGTLHGVKPVDQLRNPSRKEDGAEKKKFGRLGNKEAGACCGGDPHGPPSLGLIYCQVMDVKPMRCPRLRICVVGSFGVWWNFEMDFEKFQWICYLSPCESRRVLAPNANHQWLITSSYGLVSWRGDSHDSYLGPIPLCR